MVLPEVFLSNNYKDFQINRVNKQYAIVNRLRLTPQLTTIFSEIIQPEVIQNTFLMSIVDKFSQWNKLDERNQRGNSTEIKISNG